MLFEEAEAQNLLPQDGEVYFWPAAVAHELAEQYLQRLQQEIFWRADEARIYGKHIITRRQYAWYADKHYEYTYSGFTRQAMLWTPLLIELKARVEQVTGKQYNSCLLNLYPDGDTGMAWHRDDETDLLQNGSIASLSFGARRKFSLKHIDSNEKREVMLDSGDLLEMAGETQSYWRHCVPKSKRVKDLRINLTFRQMV